MKKRFSSIFTETLKKLLPFSMLLGALYLIMAIYSIKALSSYRPHALIGFADPALSANLFYLLGEFLPVNLFIPFFFTVLLTVFAFDFISARKKNDFYGALAFSKGEMYYSTALGAGVASIAPMLIIMTFFTVALSVIHGSFFDIAGKMAITAFNTSAGCLIFVGASALSMMLTGNKLSSIILAAHIVIMPRAMIVAAYDSTLMYGRTLGVDYDSFFLLSPQFNVPADIILSLTCYHELPWLSSSILSGLYTLCLSVMYAFLGLLAFKKRGFQNDGTSLSTAAQIAFNTTCTLSLVMLTVMVLCPAYLGNDLPLQQPLLTVLVILIIFVAVIARIISVRSFKKLWLGFISAGVALALLVTVSGVSLVSRKLVFSLLKGNITAASLQNEFYYSAQAALSSVYGYPKDLNLPINEQTNLDSIYTKNKSVTSVLSGAVGRSYNASTPHRLTADITVGHVIKIDNVTFSLTARDADAVYQTMLLDESFCKSFYKLKAPANDINVVIDGFLSENAVTASPEASTPPNQLLSSADQAELYQIFYDEFNSLSSENKGIVTGYKNGNFSPSISTAANIVTMCVYRTADDPFVSVYMLSKSVTPKTYEKYIGLYNRRNQSLFSSALESPDAPLTLYVESIENNKSITFKLNKNATGMSLVTCTDRDGLRIAPANIDKTFAALKSQLKYTAFKIDEPYWHVTVEKKYSTEKIDYYFSGMTRAQVYELYDSFENNFESNGGIQN